MALRKKAVSREFKIQTVRLAIESGADLTQVAKFSGVNLNMLNRWIAEYAGYIGDAFRSVATVNRNAEHRSPEMEHGSLEKAAACCAQDVR